MVCSLETMRLPLASTSPPTTTRTRFTSVSPSEASTTITRSPAAELETTAEVVVSVGLVTTAADEVWLSALLLLSPILALNRLPVTTTELSVAVATPSAAEALWVVVASLVVTTAAVPVVVAAVVSRPAEAGRGAGTCVAEKSSSATAAVSLTGAVSTVVVGAAGATGSAKITSSASLASCERVSGLSSPVASRPLPRWKPASASRTCLS